MSGEEKVQTVQSSKQAVEASEASSQEPSLIESWEEMQRLKRELALAPDEPECEDIGMTDEQMEALSDEELDQRIDLYEKRVRLNELQKELDRKALNMGLLKFADKAPALLRSEIQWPTMSGPGDGQQVSLRFHTRSIDNQQNSNIRVEDLENRESLQPMVKQIMEQIVADRIEPRTASLLLRAVQIADSTLRPRRVRARKRKATGSEADPRGNPEQNSA